MRKSIYESKELLKLKKRRQNILDALDECPECIQYFNEGAQERLTKRIKEFENALTDLKYATSKIRKDRVMKNYLSYGGGVNSTALLFWLQDQGIDFEAVYSDHKTDYPETREYVQMLQNKGFPITILSVNVEGFDSLYEYCYYYKIIPMRIMRWCSHKFKVRPLQKHFKKPCIVYLGMDSGEPHRAKPYDKNGMVYSYPFVEEGIDRRQCTEIIKKHGFTVPPKSGCFICPFQRKSQFKHLRDKYPDLWCKALKLEKITNERLTKKPNGYPMYLRDKPLEQIVQEGQDDLFGWRIPCQCGL